jgi:hypothetical protein
MIDTSPLAGGTLPGRIVVTACCRSRWSGIDNP